MAVGKTQRIATINKKNLALVMIKHLVLEISADTIKQQSRGSTETVGTGKAHAIVWSPREKDIACQK